jgi:hypothetical protein
VGAKVPCGEVVEVLGSDRHRNKLVKMKCAHCGTEFVCMWKRARSGFQKSCRCQMVKRFKDFYEREVFFHSWKLRNEILFAFMNAQGTFKERVLKVAHEFRIDPYAVTFIRREAIIRLANKISKKVASFVKRAVECKHSFISIAKKIHVMPTSILYWYRRQTFLENCEQPNSTYRELFSLKSQFYDISKLAISELAA